MPPDVLDINWAKEEEFERVSVSNAAQRHRSRVLMFFVPLQQIQRNANDAVLQAKLAHLLKTLPDDYPTVCATDAHVIVY